MPASGAARSARRAPTARARTAGHGGCPTCSRRWWSGRSAKAARWRRSRTRRGRSRPGSGSRFQAGGRATMTQAQGTQAQGARHAGQTLPVQTHAQGDVPDEAMDLAVTRVRSQLRHAHEPVLFARVKLTLEPDPAVERPAIAQVNVDLNGRPLRAQAAAATLRDAIEILSDKLRIQLERAERNWAKIRGSLPADEPGEWRHQSIPSPRLPYYPRPVEERGIVRHKSYGLATMTPGEAVADMELLDYDFHLFTERSTGQDSVIYRAGGGYRLDHPQRGARAQAQPGAGTDPAGGVRAAVPVLRELRDRARQHHLPQVRRGLRRDHAGQRVTWAAGEARRPSRRFRGPAAERAPAQRDLPGNGPPTGFAIG